ncbi:MAG: YceI family protein, partial [Saprospiraceae bacterium]|nr:YceI family protein [Saprospiraceae bacterium]
IQAESSGLIGIIQPEAKKFAFSVRLSTLEGFNSMLQKEHFNENYLESVKFPHATYSGKLLDNLDVTTPGKFQIRSKGIFSIHGISRERILNQTVTLKDGWITVESTFTIMLEDYNISIPRIVYKKIAEEIQVSIEAKAKL